MLSGGPAVSTPTVRRNSTPAVRPGIPVFGICYGFQAMARALGGTVARTGTSEYGRTEMNVPAENCIPASRAHSRCGWMPRRRRDRRTGGFSAWWPPAREPRWRRSRTAPPSRRCAVSPRGDALPARPAGAQPVPARFRRHWASRTPANIAESLIEAVRAQIGDAHAICGLSGEWTRGGRGAGSACHR